ncbi:hypothetical protein JKP75_16855 [Blastococcus sp. TML/M2B]|uniref:DUF5667 domain-containing protein n=1 Tax=unclassified Blastococcus TaxID=2619396 RepID=UPI001909842E|nr:MULTISPECIES: DUF5667 domain-containing protein [unclassified Blastococcus]MBN1094075.1 hypothetical protein [Blastococcus sp. TML/M2B]MBN1095804.1 hypothetical protein [Blastococcus sp. TML/C7B]
MNRHESDAAAARRAAGTGEDPAAGVVAMLQELAPQLEVDPDPAFRAATRQRLVAMAAVRTPEPARPSLTRRLLAARASDAPARWRTRATAGLAGAALTVTSLATLVALSTGARPGDVLYGLKRGTEQTQLALAGDSRGQVLLDLARTRLDELRALGGDAGRAEATLATMDQQTREGAAWLAARALGTSDAAPLDDLSGWAVEQSAQLGAVRTGLPAPAADDVDGSLALLGEISARADGLRLVLACPAGPAPTATDGLGPVPNGCLPETPAPKEPGTGGSPSAPSAGSGVVTAPAPSSPAQQPAVPAGPGGAQPAHTTAPQPPGSSSSPVPSTAPVPGPDVPGLLPLPAPPPATSAPSPLVDVPLPLPCLDLPVLLRVGRC